MGKLIIVLIVLVAVATGAAWIMAGRAEGPAITITQPAVVGQTGNVAAAIDAPRGRLTRLEIVLEQDGVQFPVLAASGADADRTATEDAAPPTTIESVVARESEDRVTVTQPIGKRSIPDLKAGSARVLVTAARPVLFGLREADTTAVHDFEVRLTPPQIAVLSLHHFINYGGSEMIVYRVTPADTDSGVRVGEHEYRGYPASGAGIKNADPAMRVAFFALLWNQEVDTPMSLYARDTVGNETVGTFDHQVFRKNFRASRIEVNDAFLRRVVPAILQNSTEFQVEDPSNLVASYLEINRELRRQNDATIAALAKQTAPEILWQGAFKQLINTAVESGFADRRTYYYEGEEIDRQVHLGFDLASTVAAPVLSANSGRIVHAGWLGIYGNCVIVDHGMGLQSLYAHLSSIEVAVGDMVEKDQRLGRTGATGLAGGDHLHFTMLLDGHAVTPIDWWSQQWIQDRIVRKLREADSPE